jgi:hypothetical protein
VSRCEARWLLEDLQVTRGPAWACMAHRACANGFRPWAPWLAALPPTRPPHPSLAPNLPQLFVEAGDGEAMQRVGQMMAAGYGLKQDAEGAAAWLNQAW